MSFNTFYEKSFKSLRIQCFTSIKYAKIEITNLLKINEIKNFSSRKKNKDLD